MHAATDWPVSFSVQGCTSTIATRQHRENVTVYSLRVTGQLVYCYGKSSLYRDKNDLPRSPIVGNARGLQIVIGRQLRVIEKSPSFFRRFKLYHAHGKIVLRLQHINYSRRGQILPCCQRGWAANKYIFVNHTTILIDAAHDNN